LDVFACVLSLVRHFHRFEVVPAHPTSPGRRSLGGTTSATSRPRHSSHNLVDYHSQHLMTSIFLVLFSTSSASSFSLRGAARKDLTTGHRRVRPALPSSSPQHDFQSESPVLDMKVGGGGAGGRGSNSCVSFETCIVHVIIMYHYAPLSDLFTGTLYSQCANYSRRRYRRCVRGGGVNTLS